MIAVNSIRTINYLKEHYGEPHSKQEIADALGISIRSVTGTVNSLTKKGYCIIDHIETIEVAPPTETRKGQYKEIKYHVLTEEGLRYDPIKEEEEKAAEKAAAKERKAAEKAAKEEA